MHNLSTIGPRKGARKQKKRRGLGAASGLGKTAGRGQKGQGARGAGSSLKGPGFEGGQMPLYRRVPKRGFKNPFRKDYVAVNVAALADAKAGTVVDRAWLAAHGLIPKDVRDGVKLLGQGEIRTGITVRVEKASKAAIQKIEAAGGKVELA